MHRHQAHVRDAWERVSPLHLLVPRFGDNIMQIVRLKPDDDGFVDVPDASVCHQLTHDDDGDLEIVSLVIQ